MGVAWSLSGLLDMNYPKRALLCELQYIHKLDERKVDCSLSVGQAKANNRRNIEVENGETCQRKNG